MAQNINEYVVEKIIDYHNELQELKNQIADWKENSRILCNCIETDSSTWLYMNAHCKRCRLLHDIESVIACSRCESLYCVCCCVDENAIGEGEEFVCDCNQH